MCSLAAAIHRISGGRSKQMLPYQGDAKKLEKLLEKLFEDDESTPKDVKVWKGRRSAETYGSCCTYNYSDYGG